MLLKRPDMPDRMAEEFYEAAKAYIDSWPWYHKLWMRVRSFFIYKRYWCLVRLHRWNHLLPLDPNIAVRMCERCCRIEKRDHWLHGKWKRGMKGRI